MRNPYARDVATVATAAGRDAVRGAVEAAAEAFEAWAETPVSERRALLDGAAIGRVSELVQHALAHGAQLVIGGEAEGLVYKPAVLRGVRPAMRSYREESLGPSVSVLEVAGAERALAVANDSDYGLSASIFSRDYPI